MSQTTLCRNFGVREGEGHLFEVGIIGLCDKGLLYICLLDGVI